MKNKKKAFTLVELIVIISLLAILGTISSIPIMIYLKNARDGKRISDIGNIKEVLSIYYMDKGVFPNPDNPEKITYNGSTIWTQGTFGSNIIQLLNDISKVPHDPLYKNEFSYSVTNNKGEYQLGTILEGNLLSSNTIINTANANLQEHFAYILGTFNGIYVTAKYGTKTYFFAVPSIIAADLGNKNLINIITNEWLSYNEHKNLPYSYIDNGLNMTGGFTFSGSTSSIIFSGGLKDLSTLDTLKTFTLNLQNFYAGTILENDIKYKDIIDLTISSDLDDEKKIVSDIGFLINKLRGGIIDIDNYAY